MFNKYFLVSVKNIVSFYRNRPIDIFVKNRLLHQNLFSPGLHHNLAWNYFTQTFSNSSYISLSNLVVCNERTSKFGISWKKHVHILLHPKRRLMIFMSLLFGTRIFPFFQYTHSNARILLYGNFVAKSHFREELPLYLTCMSWCYLLESLKFSIIQHCSNCSTLKFGKIRGDR